ncbi:MAG TPA: hypothetical protein VHD37_01585 [Candidatus Paceibacterota bacterium]|nr:hypothetical protein [Candidatus Paceibacterota bacterium]
MRKIYSMAVLVGIFAFVFFLYDTQIRQASAFVPSDVSGLVEWLDASQITGKADGDSVATWTDASGNGYDATAVGGSPTYQTNILNGRPVLRFVAASSQKMRAHPTVNTPYTLFVVARLNGGSNGRILGSIYPNNQNYLCGWWNGFENTMYGEGFVRGGSDSATTNWHQYTCKGTGSLTTFYDYGVSLASNNSGVAGLNSGLALGGYDPTGDQELSNFDIAEVIIYNVALSDSDRAAVEAYLYNKYFVAPVVVSDPPGSVHVQGGVRLQGGRLQ